MKVAICVLFTFLFGVQAATNFVQLPARDLQAPHIRVARSAQFGGFGSPYGGFGGIGSPYGGYGSPYGGYGGGFGGGPSFGGASANAASQSFNGGGGFPFGGGFSGSSASANSQSFGGNFGK